MELIRFFHQTRKYQKIHMTYDDKFLAVVMANIPSAHQR